MNIGSLFVRDKDAWSAEFFPEYFMLFNGMPTGVRVAEYDPYNPPIGGIKMGGMRSVPEMTPWAFASSDIQPNGVRVVERTYRDYFGRERKGRGVEPVSEEEFRAWCDSINYFRNGGLECRGGGPGLDPSLLLGTFDVRTQAYRDRGRYPLVVGPAGTYTYGRGPSSDNPWGVNATFTPRGSEAPIWVSSLWGPDARPDGMDIPGVGFVPMWDEQRDGPKPSQQEYNAERTPQALGYL